MRDVNLELASALYDMAAIAGDSQRAWGTSARRKRCSASIATSRRW
jgi:hypothetical protein